MLNTLQGGKFGHGFVSAGVTEALSPAISQTNNIVAGTIASAVVGGTVSELSGGSFANGATTGAFQYLFNNAAHGMFSTENMHTTQGKLKPQYTPWEQCAAPMRCALPMADGSGSGALESMDEFLLLAVSPIARGMGLAGRYLLATETRMLQQHLAGAVARFEVEGFTRAQQVAVARNPNLAATFKGERIDAFIRQSVASDSRLRNLVLTPRGQMGPDFYNPGRNLWWDVTTQASWSNHVMKYNPGWGYGVLLGY